jgi:hypothetical protein
MRSKTVMPQMRLSFGGGSYLHWELFRLLQAFFSGVLGEAVECWFADFCWLCLGLFLLLIVGGQQGRRLGSVYLLELFGD